MLDGQLCGTIFLGESTNSQIVEREKKSLFNVWLLPSLRYDIEIEKL